MAHKLAILALDDVIGFDVSIVCDTFRHVRDSGGNALYSIVVCGPKRRIRTAHYEIRLDRGLDALDDADTVVVAGVPDTAAPLNEKVLAVLRGAAQRGARIASICTGAFVLAAAGLLDGRRATTHWLTTEELARRYPRVRVDPDVLFVDEGSILTSAGASAGLDLCFHMIRQDFGAEISATIARMAVAPPERRGGQAQFITAPPPMSRANLAPLLQWLEENLTRPISIAEMAHQAGMSERTFCRRFRDQTGTTPLKWLNLARVRRAQIALETTRQRIEDVAAETGFESALNFRLHFRRVTGTAPTDYRKSFGASEMAASA